MNGVSCFQLSLSFQEISNFKKFVKCENYEADNVIFTTQSYIKCLRCAFLVNPLLKRDQSKIVINDSTCDTSLFIINLFPMAARSFPVLCNLLVIFHYFFLLKNKTKQSKKSRGFLKHFVIKTIGMRKRRFDRSTVIIKQSEDKNFHKY